MYLRTGNLFKDFVIEKKDETTTARGRPKASYDKSKGNQLRAVLADADPREKERWRQQQHPISHIITQKGAPLAKEGDRLIFGSQIFYIQGVDDPAGLGIWTIYYVEERKDTHED